MNSLIDNAMVAFEDEPELEVSLSEMLDDAITGVGFPTIAIALTAEKQYMAFFCGNQHNENWRWNSDKLRALSEPQLQALYYNLKVAQHGR